MKTYIIHRGNKNEKVRGRLRIVEDYQQGRKWLIGDQLIKTLHWTDRAGCRKVDEVFASAKIEITNCSITIKG